LSDPLKAIRHILKPIANIKKKMMEKFMLIFHGGLGPDASPAQMQENMGKWF